jgi:hypothetical protein
MNNIKDDSESFSLADSFYLEWLLPFRAGRSWYIISKIHASSWDRSFLGL